MLTILKAQGNGQENGHIENDFYVDKMQEHIPIEKTVDLTLDFPKVADRYYESLYFIKQKLNQTCFSESNENSNNASKLDKTTLNGQDTCILRHSNKVCVITISHKHPVFMEKKAITKIDFNVGSKNRLDNKVSGKSKKGAQHIEMTSEICKILCKDGSNYTVYSGVCGKLIEVNDRLVENPQLLMNHPRDQGYLAIILPRLMKFDLVKHNLLSKDEYEEVYRKAQPQICSDIDMECNK